MPGVLKTHQYVNNLAYAYSNLFKQNMGEIQIGGSRQTAYIYIVYIYIQLLRAGKASIEHAPTVHIGVHWECGSDEH